MPTSASSMWTSGKTEADIKIDSDDVEGVAFEKSGPRMFVNVRGKNAVEVYDRKTRALMATWSDRAGGKESYLDRLRRECTSLVLRHSRSRETGCRWILIQARL